MTELSRKRLLLLGLDGVTWRLLDPLIADGYMPNLAHLKETGAWGDLESTLPPVTAAAWPTFQTGVVPGKHGALDFNQYTGDNYKTHPVSASVVKIPTMWQLFSDAGKKVVCVNVPVTYPPRPINGFMVTGILTPGLSGEFTYPPELSDELRQRFPGYIILTPQTLFNTSRLEDFVDKCIHTEEERIELFMYLLQEKCPDWDVAMFHVQQLDILQHAVYWWLDKSGPRFDPEKYAIAARAYQAVDKIIGRIMALMTPDTMLAVLSDHGHGPIYRTVNVNSLLAQEGLLSFNRQRGGNLVRKGINLALRLDRWNLNRRLGRQRRRKLVDSLNQQVAVNWGQTKAFMVNGWVWPLIYINVAGRESQGIVQPGAEYDEVKAQIMRILTDLRDPETGASVFEQVLSGDEAFPGGNGRIPDVTGVPTAGFEFSSSFYQEVGDIFRSNLLKRDHTGSHSMDGIVTLVGPTIAPGELSDARLVDMFATSLAWMDMPIPDNTDGKVLQTAFTTPIQERFYAGEASAAALTGDDAFTADEVQEIEDRLRALGYMS
ncbi:MAG: alkaline phosphatase family protein [Anaerolineales bacterium]|nr:alkaline phosphatase family protein [Anaerolineales bacterium]MCB8954697.1 alkaline phosphatase family protein [Ardenticatenales bacterium]